MQETRIKISSIVENQLPFFVKEEFPLIEEFLKQYYISVESKGSVLDLLQNLDTYVKIENFINIIDFTTLENDLDFFDETIEVESTYGFPDRYGLIKINDEIITYESKDATKFYNCKRGFSGIVSVKDSKNTDNLVFSTSQTQSHTADSFVENLSILFLKEFFIKIKRQILPGFEDRELYSQLDKKLFITRSKDFYSSKGSDDSFKILFKSLYGEKIEVIKPRDFLLEPSSAEYNVSTIFVVESLEGDPLEFINKTIFQDQNEYSNFAQGTVNYVEKILRNNKIYYVLSLDSDYDRDINVTNGTIIGKFSVHPKTKIISNIPSQSTTIDVDSTVGFPDKGTLIVDFGDGGINTITYTSKSLNQFYGCQGIDRDLKSGNNIRLDNFAYGYSSVDRERIIKFRVTTVLKDLDLNSQGSLYSKNDPIQIRSLGATPNQTKYNNWLVNSAISYLLENVETISSTQYKITTIDDNTLSVGDSIRIYFDDGTTTNISVLSVENKKQFFCRSIDRVLNLTQIEKIERILNKSKIKNYPELNSVSTNVQNIYLDESDNLHVASNSIPSYFEQELLVSDFSKILNGTFFGEELNIGNHTFYTGDSVVYIPGENNNKLNIQEGIYFVKKISNTSIKLSRSRSDIYKNKFVEAIGSLSGNENKLELFDYSQKTLRGQKLIRKIENPYNDDILYETKPGTTGILVNGVEILNYKSKDGIYFGPIEDVIVTSGGENYDVITPPILNAVDDSGSGFEGICHIEGQLERIDVLDGGFDLLEDPKITIVGGGSFGYKLKANLVSFKHTVQFDSSLNSNLVNLVDNTIGFSTFHNFRNIEQVVYKTNGQKSISGLTNQAIYYISSLDENTVSLYKTYNDAALNVNRISLGNTIGDYGSGIHEFESISIKKKISSISIENIGSVFKNKEVIASASNINVFSNQIKIKNHGFSTGEIVTYKTSGNMIGGLINLTNYYVVKVDDDNFKLCQIGTTEQTRDFYLNTAQYIKLQSSGSGEHSFNYPNIVVNVSVSTGTNNSNINLIPIVRGKIFSVFVKTGGSNYGSSEIINYNRQPKFNVSSGSGAKILPVINSGKITKVLIINGGSGYTSNPDIIISGSGTGAKLVANIQSGKIVSVNVVFGGIGYSSDNTKINVLSPGSNAKFESKTKIWTINLFEKFNISNQLTLDDGVLTNSSNNNGELQYTHLYAPRKLRSSLLSTKIIGGQQRFLPDFRTDNSGKEISSDAHSPLVGWSYDGNPIYGPYGYSTPFGGPIKSMISGYVRKDISLIENRPNYPSGFFIEDYEFNSSGDLDEYNGRFCVTPEFPNGVYAYFATINAGPVEVNPQSNFKDCKLPEFPYFIGNFYKSKPIDFNFSIFSNQDSIDISKTNWLRNTNFYNIGGENSFYEYLLNPSKISEQKSIIKEVSKGTLDAVNIVSPGENYKVDDLILFKKNDVDLNAINASAFVSKIDGKTVTSIVTDQTILQNIEIIPFYNPNQFLGFLDSPHSLNSGDVIKFTNLSYPLFSINEEISIIVPKNVLTLSKEVQDSSITGIITTFDILNGNLAFPLLRENDLFNLNNEQIKILTIDRNNSKITVQRSPVGISHTALSKLVEIPRKIIFNANSINDYENSPNYNETIYFNPITSIGLGNSFGPGITSSIFIGINNYNAEIVGIETGISTILYFKNENELSLFNSGYINIVNSSNPSINVEKVKILSIGQTSISVDFDTSLLSIGYGITAFANKLISVDIPTRSIYLPGNNLNTNDEVYYSNEQNSSIEVSIDTITSSPIDTSIPYYIAKIDSNLVGLSSEKLFLNSTNKFIGVGTTSEAKLLYFVGVGSGINHSFTTNRKVLSADIIKNKVTVTTENNHNLLPGDKVFLENNPTNDITYKVVYDDLTRRTLINPKSFTILDANINGDYIVISNHGLVTGQKVLYTSTNIVGGLIDHEIYYVVKLSENKIALSNNLYDSTLKKPNIINLLSPGNGIISLINPEIKVIEGQNIIFDVSDSSLSFQRNLITYSAFDFNFYTDSNFKNELLPTLTNNVSNIQFEGRIGIDGNAKIKIKTEKDSIKKFYYRLDPINLNISDESKKEVIVDSENIENFSTILVNKSAFSGEFSISGVTTNTFDFTLSTIPENLSYNQNNSIIKYSTNSKNTLGGINEILIINKGSNYTKLPQIDEISSGTGSNAILKPLSFTIGKSLFNEILDVSFDYFTDNSLRPIASLPQILEIIPQSTIKEIKIKTPGVGYLTSPDLIVIDGLTDIIVDDLILRYNLTSNTVDIIQNVKSLNNISPKIIPTNNSNGLLIKDVVYNQITGNTTITLSKSFSDIKDFPFNIGDKILIENVDVSVKTLDDGGNLVISKTGKGFNSKDYNYQLFSITSTDPNIGGSNATITYNLSQFLKSGEFPGIFNTLNNLSTVVPEKYFPIFETLLEKAKYFKNEIVKSNNSFGKVIEWDPSNELLKIDSTDIFENGKLLVGTSSNSEGLISNILSETAVYSVDSSFSYQMGWKSEFKFLNSNLQKIHDSDYYQYFSYSIKSKIPYEIWNEPVQSLSHVSGFKKFSDLIIETEADWVDNLGPDDVFVGIKTEQNFGSFTGVSEFDSVVDLNCINDFDLVREVSFSDGNRLLSNELVFNSKILQDYFESVGNIVLTIDDISDQFNSVARPTSFAIVDTFRLLPIRYRKYFTFIKDKRYTAEKQICLVSLLYNDNYGYINQYGRVETFYDMGAFDFIISGEEGNLLFYPTRFEVNDFSISTFSINLEEFVSGIGSTSLGNIINIDTSNVLVSSASTLPIEIIRTSSANKGSKVLIQISSQDKTYYEVDELSIVHNDLDIELLEYGQLTTHSFGLESIAGLGTYGAYFEGSDLIVTFTPNENIFNINSPLSINTVQTLINHDGLISGEIVFDTTSLKSQYTGISSSPNPIETFVSSTPKDKYESSYYIVSVSDKTNNHNQISELLGVSGDFSGNNITEYALISTTNSELGEFNLQENQDEILLSFTPSSNIDVEVRVFQLSLGLVDITNTNTEVDLNNASLTSGFGNYSGTLNDIKKSFDLKHRELPIFSSNIDPTDSNTINLQENYISIPGNYFTTGEKLTYIPYENNIENSIGIAVTDIIGIGLTDRLPENVYVVKDGLTRIRLTSTPEDALSQIPKTLELTSVGIGTLHKFICEKQNSRVLISIDNVIQSPVVSTGITANITEPLTQFDTKLVVSGITSFFGGDLIKVNDEIMRIQRVGFGSIPNSFIVQREWMGTISTSHLAGSSLVKLSGDYNIVENTLNFVSAPYGKVPIGTSSNRPDDRDYIGITTSSSFNGRSFMKSGIPNTNIGPYTNNFVFDDISSQFTGITTQFRLKIDGNDFDGVAESGSLILIKEIVQQPRRDTLPVYISGNYILDSNSGITTISFPGDVTPRTEDIKRSNVPVGGIIVSIGSTKGFSYQPLISAGGTCIISELGEIQLISIGNSGSGYRSGIQTVNVGVYTSSLDVNQITNIGIASIMDGHVISVNITNPGFGYTNSNPPSVIFDEPLSYSNIPLIYSSSSLGSGIGSGAIVDIKVSLDSSVLDFEIKNNGYGYLPGETLTVSVGGSEGIPILNPLNFEEFQIYIDDVENDKFSGWNIGDLLVLDPIDELFDGITRIFPLKYNNDLRTIQTRSGSNLDIQSALLIFINDILQVPGESYTFNGGSFITFKEPPRFGDTSKIIFYAGNSIVDILSINIEETIKVGDKVTVLSDSERFSQNSRSVKNINSSDSIITNTYSDVGISNDVDLLRPIRWCKQTDDIFIGGSFVTKDRLFYEPNITPTTNIIKNIGLGSTIFFVDNLRTFFDSLRENAALDYSNNIKILSQDNIFTAIATAFVIPDPASTEILSIDVIDGGFGYISPPPVYIDPPIGFGVTATAVASISAGIVTTITIINPGLGYTITSPPKVRIESPTPNVEIIENVTFEGDYGIIVGVATTSVGIATEGVIFDFYIPSDSFMRSNSIVGVSVTISQIEPGYYFRIKNSNIGDGLTSLDSSGSLIGIGSTFVDNVYEVIDSNIVQKNVIGVGLTYVNEVVVNVSNNLNVPANYFGSFLGEYSWGKINTFIRKNPKQFNSNSNNVDSNPIISRLNPLKFVGYSSAV